MVQFITVPFGGLNEWIQEETPNLLSFVDRVKARAWSDWDSIVSSLEMNTHLPKPEPAEGEAATEDGGDAPAAATDAAAAAEQAKKDAEAKKAEKKRLAVSYCHGTT